MGRVVRPIVDVASAPAFTGRRQVAGAAPEVFVAAFGDPGRNARSAVGVGVLSFHSPLEIDAVVETTGVAIADPHV